MCIIEGGGQFQRLAALRIAARCDGRPKGAPTARRVVLGAVRNWGIPFLFVYIFNLQFPFALL
jgi:hypothetical protein